MYCTEFFWKKYDQLTSKKYRKHYSCFKSKLLNKLKDFSKNAINGDVLIVNGDVKCVKSRLVSCTNNGSSYGFRLIIVENKITNTYYLLDAYPKYGTLSENASINVDSKIANELLSNALMEKNNNKLIKVHIEKDEVSFQKNEITESSELETK